VENGGECAWWLGCGGGVVFDLAVDINEDSVGLSECCDGLGDAVPGICGQYFACWR
jgi:hypothetical protein